MSKATRAALHRTIRRSCHSAEEALNRAERKVKHALHRQFLNPDLDLDEEEREIMDRWFREHVAQAFQTLHEALRISRVDVVRFRAQLAAELIVDARLQKETTHEIDPGDAAGDLPDGPHRHG